MEFGEVIFRDLMYFFKGFAAGLVVSLPLGPSALLCINQTLRRGLVRGLAAGLGIASADTLYGSIVGFGLTSLSDFIFGWLSRLRFIAGFILVILGVTIYILKPSKKEQSGYEGNLIHAFFSTFGITLANPLILLVFAAVFAAIGLDNLSHDWELTGILILGIFSGALSWWICVCSTISLLHGRATSTSLSWTNKVSGLMVVAFGIYTLYGRF